jgi:solute carrier family 6 (neurotransmitter transporter, dopamine) member 3
MGTRAYEPLKVTRTNEIYSYPEWANIVGWCLAFSSSLWIPIIAIYFLCKAKGNLIQRIKYTIKPLNDRKLNNKRKNEQQQFDEENVDLNL